MNCKQVEELLPLYAGRELEEKHAVLVTEHVQTCVACTRIADEYRESVQLTEQFATPVFSEGVYAGIRQRVLRDLETEAMAPAWSQTIASLLRSRLRWAIVNMLLIAVSLCAVYFFVNRQNDGQQVAVNPSAKTQPGMKERSNSEPQGGRPVDPPPSIKTGGKEQQLANIPQSQRKRSRNALVDRMNTVSAKSRDAVSTVNNVSPEPSNLPESMIFPLRDSAALGKTLRVEIQTNNPNIRIIWFTQEEAKPVIPSSKGT